MTQAKKNDILKDLINEEQEIIHWSKALPLTRYEGEAPPIILDNMDKVIEICNSDVKMRNLPSKTDLSVLTSHFDPSSGKWLESRRAATHSSQ